MRKFRKGLMFFAVLVVFLCSFIFTSTFLNGNVYIKQFGVELFIGLTSMFWCFTVLFGKDRFEINLTIIDLVIILLLLLHTGFLLIFNYSFIEHSLPFYYGMFYFISSFLIRVFPSKELNNLKNRFLIIVPIVIMLHVIIVILQQTQLFPPLHGYFNNGSTFGNPDMIGSYIAILLPFCFMQNKGWKKTGYFAFLIGILLLIFVQARSALLAMILCGILWLIINKRISKKQVLIVVSLSVLLVGLLIVWHPESVYGRFFVWFVSLKMIIEKPLGWGIFAFEKYYPEFQASYLALNQHLPDFISPDIVHSPFNEFLNIGVTLGVFGLSLFVILVVFVFYNVVKSKSPFIYPLSIFTVISLFYFPFKIAPLVALIIPLLAFISKKSKIIYQKQLSRFTSGFIISVLLVASLFLVSNSILSYRNQKNWRKAVSYFTKGKDLIESERLFLELYPVMKENGRFLITYSNLKYKQGYLLKALELLEKAENYFCDIVLSIKLAKLYHEVGDYRKAEEKFNLAENIAPDRFFAPYAKILFYIDIGEFEKAYFSSKKLYCKPIKQSLYADPYIIKSKLQKIITEYENP